MSTEDDFKELPGYLTKKRGPKLPQKNTKPTQLSNETSEYYRNHEGQQEKERLRKQITDVCESLELQQSENVADLPAIKELCGLLKELAAQSGLQLDSDIQQGMLDFPQLMKLLQKHRDGSCNSTVCLNILNCLLKVFCNADASPNQAELLKELSHSLLATANYDKSIMNAKKLVNVAITQSNRKLEAEAYYILVKNYTSKGSLEDAQFYLDKYLESSEQSEDKLCKGYAAMGASIVLYAHQKYEEALKKAEEFLAVARCLHSRRAECEAVLHMAKIHLTLFNIQKSLDFYSKGLEIAQEQHYTKLVMGTKLNQASVYSLMGKYHRSYNIRKSLASQQDDYDDKAFTYAVICNLSVDALILNRHKESLKFARDSLAIAKILGAAQPLALAYGNIGLAQEKLEDYTSAIESYQKCLEIGKQMPNDRIINNSYCNLGRAHEGKGDKKKAEEFYEKALAAPQPPSTHWCDTEDFRFSADYLLAKMAVEAKNIPKAKKYLGQVVQRCDSLRKSVQESPLKICFNDTQKKPYQYLQHVLLEEGAEDEALLVGEKGRARDFYDKFVRKEGVQSGHLNSPQALLNLAKSQKEAVLFLSQLDVVNKMCIWLISPIGGIEKVLVLPNDQLDDVLKELCLTMYELQTQNEALEESTEFRGIQVEEDELDISLECWEEFKETTEEIENETARLDCPLSDLCTSKTMEKTAVESGIPKPIIAEEVHRAPNSNLDCTRAPGSSSSKNLLESFSKVVDKLSELVLRPIEQHLERFVKESTGKLHLLIIPQGKTFNIPYAALRLKDGKPLCSQICAHEAFSFHSYWHSIKLEGRSQMQRYEETLIVGNPTDDLHFAQEEAETIAGLLGVSPVTGSSATLTKVLRSLPDAPIIHFACHGTADGKSLLLATEENQNCDIEGDSSRSFLTVEDISKLTITAKMVVLSACHTARGAISNEGVLGLARAFLISGAKSVVTALWAIPDNATKMFMRTFYKNLVEMPIGDALSRTMCQIQEEESLKNVVHWGSFKVLGANCQVLFNETS